MDVVTPDGLRKLHCVLLMAALDLPARALVLNMNQFNGKYGCSFCNDEGVTERGKPLHRFWLPDRLADSRTQHSMMTNAHNATTTNKVVCSLLLWLTHAAY